MKLLPSKDSAVWRGVMTALQTLIAVVGTVLLVPGVKEALTAKWPQYAGLVAIVAGLVSTGINVARPNVKNY